MSGGDHQQSNKKAGLSGLFRVRVAAAALLMASATAGVAEPLTVEVTDVAPILDQRTRQPAIAIKMTPASTKLFAELTAKNVGHPLAFRIDGRTVMAPIIREPVMIGSVQISGNWTLRDTKDLADRIATGQSKLQVEAIND